MKMLLFCAYLLLFLNAGQATASKSVTKKIKTGNLDIQIKNNKIWLNIRKNDGTSMRNFLITKGAEVSNEETMSIEQDCESLTTCVQSNNVTHTKIKADPEGETVQVRRWIAEPGASLTDCYRLAEDTEWYGGPRSRSQRWPIQHVYYEGKAYLPSHEDGMGLAERYWLSSKGIYLYVDEGTPLFLDQNNYKEGHLCLVARNAEPYRSREAVGLDYELGVFAEPRQAHEHVISKHLGRPSGLPDPRAVASPIWSSRARHEVNISDTIIRRFAADITSHGFEASLIEIDDNWESCYGSAIFDKGKFPDLEGLLSDLRQKLLAVTLWVHPFINENCDDGQAYRYALENDYLVKNTEGDVRTTWWRGADGAAVVDFTNERAVEWWVSRLKKLEDIGIDGFKFDAGEVSWLPQVSELTGPVGLQPGIYTLNYTTNLAKYFGNNIDVRTGWKTQQLPVFVRMIDKDTTWTWNNGLPTVVTTLLHMNLNGYTFVLPDVIGGSGRFDNNEDKADGLPSKEIFIRWLQANVFMPTLQYSFVPWDFDNETIDISKNFTRLHAQISPKIIDLMKKSVETGVPVNLPIWWVDPLNIQAHKINDEYLLGEEILVAPVLEENAITRDVYLPAGKWKDANSMKVYAGPMWLSDYSAPLNILPHFYKV